MKKHLLKTASVFLALLTVLSLSGVGTASAEEATVATEINQAVTVEGDSYFEQYDALVKLKNTDAVVTLNANEGKTANSQPETEELEGKSGIVINSSNKWIEWSFQVTKSGAVSVELEYAPISDKNTDLLLKLTVDGRLPFSEAESLYAPRLWERVYIEGEDGRPFAKDAQGNEIAPDQEQVHIWNKVAFYDSQGLYDEPYLIYLEEGTHTLRLYSEDSSLVVGGVKLYNKAYISYEAYYEKYSSTIVKNGEATIQQAELTDLTNSASINPTYDKLNVATVPSDPTYIKLNTIGAGNWSAQGDSISYTVDIPKAGMYKIAFKGRQSQNSGLISYRTLYVNGEVPFEEALNIPFAYSQDWKIYTLGGEEEMLVYLEPGDTVTLACSPGETTEVLRNIREATTRLNTLYRKIIAITSVSPDTFQDYKVEDKISDVDKQLADITKLLRDTHEQLCEILGTKGSLASSINYVAQITEELSEKPYTIPERLSNFKTGIESLGSLTQSLSAQPLELDYIAFLPQGEELPKANAGFFDSVKFYVCQFLSSFVTDYSGYENLDDATTINVWVSTGRDQAQVLSNLIMADFSKKTGIAVKLNMVDTGTTLVRASLAGKGPDIALMMPQTTPVELAARGALVDLKDFVTEDMYTDFHESAWTSFYYQDGLYAIPETQTYSLLFYRTDIFEELGIEVPDTWDELYEAMAVIQHSNLSVGMPEIDSNNMGVSASLSVFSSMLMQRGLKNYYTDDLSRTNFDTEIAYEAFTDLCNFYTYYGLDRQMDFYSRFRSGEVPLSLRSFSESVQIQHAAPEIRGLWEMAPYLGTVKEDGTVDRTQTSVVTGAIMLRAAEKRGLKEEAFEFLKWWASADVQYEYGRDLETTLGGVGRYFTANLEAFEKSNWSSSELALIKSQLKYIRNQPTVPGSYALSRDLTSALREVIDGTNRPRRALMLYNTDINEEIARKRKEFGLES